MRLFAIGDLHLSGGDDKPMDVFGPQWDRHFLHISRNWREKVRAEDTVLVPGDISWAMRLEDAREPRLLVEFGQPGPGDPAGRRDRAPAQRRGRGRMRRLRNAGLDVSDRGGPP